MWWCLISLRESLNMQPTRRKLHIFRSGYPFYDVQRLRVNVIYIMCDMTIPLQLHSWYLALALVQSICSLVRGFSGALQPGIGTFCSWFLLSVGPSACSTKAAGCQGPLVGSLTSKAMGLSASRASCSSRSLSSSATRRKAPSTPPDSQASRPQAHVYQMDQKGE